ncbi:hypothetical protein [Methylobacterium isbiliense]|uniref:Secreted protein n=1 Tax=Methylobacterium isbiliense TaxID=315478 RepID=A0ABQ4SD21_9HYPH|nr:hypothetical protein [Methylobacterium isbiliense]MDN3623619.1 hypothetical protein [Methylobacterium isbiliense]GJD99717.1 hypothetical protein GMJLKIPL_1635 [Methylobacterium isbiliense]
MRTRILTLAALATLACAPAALAEEVIIRRDAPVERERSTVIEKRSVDTTGTVGGCETKTVRKTNEFGDTKTVRSERCD